MMAQPFLPLILGSQVKNKDRRETTWCRAGQEGAQDSEEKFQVLCLESSWQVERRRHGFPLASWPLAREAEAGLERWHWLCMGSCSASPL